MKLIDILNMISKGELKEGAKIRWDIYEYIYKDGELVRKGDYNGSYYIFDDMETRHLNVEVELIEPDKDIDVPTTEKIKELDNYDWEEGDYDYQIEIIYRKLNEVIRRLNNVR